MGPGALRYYSFCACCVWGQRGLRASCWFGIVFVLVSVIILFVLCLGVFGVLGQQVGHPLVVIIYSPSGRVCVVLWLVLRVRALVIILLCRIRFGFGAHPRLGRGPVRRIGIRAPRIRIMFGIE